MFAQMILLNGKKKLKLVYKMEKPIKILVAGVGGQGVVFLTDLIVEAAMFSDIPISTSEIHGLAQRGGTVTAGITIGENAFGFIEKAIKKTVHSGFEEVGLEIFRKGCLKNKIIIE